MAPFMAPVPSTAFAMLDLFHTGIDMLGPPPCTSYRGSGSFDVLALTFRCSRWATMHSQETAAAAGLSHAELVLPRTSPLPLLPRSATAHALLEASWGAPTHTADPYPCPALFGRRAACFLHRRAPRPPLPPQNASGPTPSQRPGSAAARTAT
eukprot:357568-Chlamydomonas_euryale.AAC.3